jgi:predicted nucleotidyltransferase
MQELKLIKFTEFFLKNPYKEVYIRELAKKLKLSPFATKKYADFLVKEGLIAEEKKAHVRYLVANTKNIFYKHAKITYSLREILNSGLIEFLKENVSNLTSIVVFGSISRGEDSEESDVDIAIIGKEKNLTLTEFEKKMKREITLHFFSWSEWNTQIKENSPFYYDVINSGIPLHGELPIIRV